MQVPHRFTAEEGSPAAIAVDRCFGASVLASVTVEALRDDGAIGVDIYSWVVSDLLNVEPWLRRAVSESDRRRGLTLEEAIWSELRSRRHS
ncbi:MAG: hypothetical protein GY856_03580 [bacterium]|nr:hypothetical protein [bacterium]